MLIGTIHTNGGKMIFPLVVKIGFLWGAPLLNVQGVGDRNSSTVIGLAVLVCYELFNRRSNTEKNALLLPIKGKFSGTVKHHKLANAIAVHYGRYDCVP